MQLVLHNNSSTEIMDLSLKKSMEANNLIHHHHPNDPVITKHESSSNNKKSLSFSVDRLLKSVSDEDTSSSSNSKNGKPVFLPQKNGSSHLPVLQQVFF